MCVRERERKKRDRTKERRRKKTNRQASMLQYFVTAFHVTVTTLVTVKLLRRPTRVPRVRNSGFPLHSAACVVNSWGS